jgi:hypothetical protein
MKRIFLLMSIIVSQLAEAQKFDGLDMNMSNISRLSDAKTRSLSPENYTGAKGRGRDGRS